MKIATVCAALLFALLVSSPAAAAIEVDSLAAGTTDSALVTGSPSGGGGAQRWFCGFSARETGGSAAATVDIYNGEDAMGELLFTFSLVASESRSEGPWSKSECILAPDGIFVDRTGPGTVALSIYSRLERP